jgi:hypothetical protein
VTGPTIAAVSQRIDALEWAVAEVGEMHVSYLGTCAECGDEWPCDTFQTVEALL